MKTDILVLRNICVVVLGNYYKCAGVMKISVLFYVPVDLLGRLEGTWERAKKQSMGGCYVIDSRGSMRRREMGKTNEQKLRYIWCMFAMVMDGLGKTPVEDHREKWLRISVEWELQLPRRWWVMDAEGMSWKMRSRSNEAGLHPFLITKGNYSFNRCLAAPHQTVRRVVIINGCCCGLTDECVAGQRHL